MVPLAEKGLRRSEDFPRGTAIQRAALAPGVAALRWLKIPAYVKVEHGVPLNIHEIGEPGEIGSI